MKQSTRHHIQRVAAGILASIITLSGIGAAHAGENGESKDYKPFACNSDTVYNLGVEFSNWYVSSYHVSDGKGSVVHLPQKSSVLSPQPSLSDATYRGDTDFSTENANYHIIWWTSPNGYNAADAECNLLHSTEIFPLYVSARAHSGKTLSEALIRRELQEKNLTILGLPMKWDTTKFRPDEEGAWIADDAPNYTFDSLLNHQTGEITNFNAVEHPQEYDIRRDHAAFSSNNVFYRVTDDGKIERLEGTTWVPLASQPPFPILSTVPYLNVGVVMVEPDQKTSHFVPFTDLEKDDFTHIATSTITAPRGDKQVSPFTRERGYGMAIFPADMKIERLSYEQNQPVPQNILDDFSRQLGYQLPPVQTLIATTVLGQNTLSIPPVTVPPVTQPATDPTGKPVLPEAAPHTSVTLTETPESWVVTTRALDGYRFTNGEYSHQFTYPHFYTLLYQPNEGEGEPVEERVAYGKQSHNPVRFHRPGYQFVGWNTKADGSGTTVTTPTVTTDTTLYAQWKKAVPMSDLTPAHKTTDSKTDTPAAEENPAQKPAQKATKPQVVASAKPEQKLATTGANVSIIALIALLLTLLGSVSLLLRRKQQ